MDADWCVFWFSKVVLKIEHMMCFHCSFFAGSVLENVDSFVCIMAIHPLKTVFHCFKCAFKMQTNFFTLCTWCIKRAAVFYQAWKHEMKPSVFLLERTCCARQLHVSQEEPQHLFSIALIWKRSVVSVSTNCHYCAISFLNLINNSHV